MSEVPISYASRKLRDNEIDSGTPFCELFAIEFGVDKFEDISGRETILFSDHRSLQRVPGSYLVPALHSSYFYTLI